MDPGIIKALSRETKALILVSEFEARRMPMFQLRSVLEAIVRDDEERKIIIDLVENDLRATGHSPEQISTFLSDLCTPPVQKAPAIDSQILATRKLRSPFAMGFDAGASSAPPPDAPRSATFGPGAFRPQSSTSLPPGVAAPSPRPAPSFMTPPPPADAPPPPPDNFAPPSRQTPAGGVALPPPPKPPVRGGATVRRSTFVFDPVSPTGSGPKPAVTSTPPGGSPNAAGLAPVGDKTSTRHNLMFASIGATPAPAAPGEAPVASTARKGTILLADDDKRARMVFRLRLEEAGFNTIEVGSGTEAWDRIQQGGISAAVLDMKMPGLHGLEVLSHIADKQLGLPVVICTAYDQLEDEFIVQTYPKLKYLVKPIAPETLVNSIKELLAVK